MAKRRSSSEPLTVLSPRLQVSFFHRLAALRKQCLTEALQDAVERVDDLAPLDAQLRKFVGARALKQLGRFGLRGEILFATPLLLSISPLLLGYYRLLYGLSQKEFYNRGPFGGFKRMEEIGQMTPRIASRVDWLCQCLAATGRELLDGVGAVSPAIVHELQLLTLGPQFRGSENTKIGDRAIASVRQLMLDIVGPHVRSETAKTVRIENAAGRTVLIEFASDPDVLITEQHGDQARFILSIEVKGGGDVSNLHNRLGEAEKSHLKAKHIGCTDLWTITRVQVDSAVAHRASPTTTQFFDLILLNDAQSPEHRRFSRELRWRLGIS